MTLLDIFLGRQRLTLTEAERAVVFRKGRIMDVLGAGEHVLRREDVIERHDLSNAVFVSKFEDALRRERNDLFEAHLTDIRTGVDEVAIVSRDGRIATVVGADARMTVWTDVGPWAVETIDLSEGFRMPKALGDRLERARKTALMTRVEVAESDVGLLFVCLLYTSPSPRD